MNKIEFKKLHSPEVALPRYMSEMASGMDVCSAEDAVLQPMETKAISTGFAMAIPKGYEAQIRPRSGLAFKYGVTVLNTPGTIDADYRGEVKVILINLGKQPFVIKIGDRIAQMVIAAVTYFPIDIVVELSDTDRGDGGFGSTGVAATVVNSDIASNMKVIG